MEGPIKKKEKEKVRRTTHPRTLAGLHARNRVLKHEPVRALLAFCTPNYIALVIRPNIPLELARSSKEHVRKRLPASRAVIRAHDVLSKVGKDAPQVRGLESEFVSHGAGRDGDWDGVRCEVCDEALDAWEELHVWPARVL